MDYKKIKAEMVLRGETQDTLAKLLGISVASLSHRFKGRVDWSVHDIDFLCSHYNKTYEELFK